MSYLSSQRKSKTFAKERKKVRKRSKGNGFKNIKRKTLRLRRKEHEREKKGQSNIKKEKK